MTDDKTLIECREVTKVFLRKKGSQMKAVNMVNLKIYKGEIVVIVGRSGMGKTTLLNLIGGLEHPTSGTVMLDGKAIDKLSRRELALVRRKKVGFIFQSFNLVPSITVLENIELALAPTGMSRAGRVKKGEDLLSTFNLADRADYLPLELSVGQQQKVAIARALANDPALILADEPTGELDPITAKEVVAKLVEVNQRFNMTLLVVSMGVFPYDLANRVLFMRDGEIVPRQEAGY